MAGDVFTKITIAVAIAWVLVAGGSGYFLRDAAESRASELKAELPEEPGLSSDGDGTKTDGTPLGGSGDLGGGADGAGDSGATDSSNGPGDAEQ